AEHPAPDGQQPALGRRDPHLPELPPLHLSRRAGKRGSRSLSATPGRLLLAIAERGSLEAACEDLGIDRDEAVRLLREAARKLGVARKERAAGQKELPGLERTGSADGKRVRV